MNDQELALCIHTDILEDLLEDQRRYLLAEANTAAPQLPGWPEMAKLCKSLNKEQRILLDKAMRQIAVDAISGVLGVIDGSTLLRKHRGEFKLTYDEQEEPLNGDLQSYFLAREQERAG